MERRLQNSLWALGAALTAALLLGSLRPAPDHLLVAPGPATNAAPIATGAVEADAVASPAPRPHRSLRRHGLSMPYFSFSSSIGG